MGFLKFLGRDKGKEPNFDSKSMEDLDRLPPPPDSADFGQKMPEFPEIPEESNFPDTEMPLPESDLGGIGDFQKFDEKDDFQEEFGPIPQEPDYGADTFAKPMLDTEEPRIEEPEPEPEKHAPEARHYETHERIKGPVFVEVGQFREVVTEISVIRRDLRKVTQLTEKLNDIEEGITNEIKKWSSTLTELQKKFVSIDKTFFEGDKK